MLIKLGQFIFAQRTLAFQEQTQTTSFTWQMQSPIGTAPTLQFLGPDAGTIILRGITLPPEFGSIHEMQKLKDIAKQGEPLLMIDAIGEERGKWCIKKITETKSIFDNNGIPLKIEFDIELIQYS